MRKSTKKTLLYFVGTLAITLIVGAIALIVYSEMILPKMSPEQVMSDAVLSESEMKEIPEIPMQEIATDEEIVVDGEPAIDETQTTDGTQGTNEMQETDDAQEIDDVQETGSVTLVFGGDICFHDPFANMNLLVQRGGKIDSCIDGGLLAQMQEADICMVNNEFPYSDRGTPIPEKAFTFRSRPENVNLLRQMGVDLVSLANNHAYDHGQEALFDTFSVLEEAGVDYVGAGRNLSEASEPAFYEIGGNKIGIVAATQIERLETPDTKGASENSAGVLRCFNEKELNHFLEVVAEAKKQCDVLIVYIHWGTENTDVLDWAQPYQADLITKAGADLIVGAHPHCLQGLDSVNGVPVVYSLGNYWFNSKALDTALLKVVVSDRGLQSVQIVPARQENCSTYMLADAEKQRVLNYLQGLSPNVTLDADGYMRLEC